MRLPILLLTSLILVLLVTTCLAAEKDAKTAAGSGKRKLLLFAKNPASWAIVKTGASGKLIYRQATGVFSLQAGGLRPRTAYALVRYADTPPLAEILARGDSNANGRMELGGIWHNWSKKFWLVAGEDVTGAPGEAGAFLAWRPEQYLFEEKPLGIPCNCPEPEEP